MKTQIVLLIAAAFAVTPLLVQAGQPAEPAHSATPAATVQKYTCEMHPEVISDKPGKCPKCGMNLVPVQPQPTPKK
jgi:hypothetical protein